MTTTTPSNEAALIVDELSVLGEALTRAEQQRAEIMANVRAIVPRALAAHVAITDIAATTGLSRPTIYRIINEEVAGVSDTSTSL